MEANKSSSTQDQAVATTPAAEQTKIAAPKHEFSIDLLNMTKAAQIQHGLRHGDYARYRQYCARRLTRLRKTLGFTHGKGRFTQKRLNVQQVTQQKHLLLPLMSAERSWSLAMELKEQQDNPRARFHMLRRLKKAVKSCNELVALCAETADDKTKLEAEAYASWMAGNLRLEEEDWAQALDSFTRARTIYDNLSKVGDADTQETFKVRVQEIDPTIRFCNYNLSQGEDLSGIRGTAAAQGASSDVLLQAKLDKVLTDLRKKQGEAMREVSWNGKTVPIKNDKLRELVLSAQDNIFEIEKLDSLEAKLELYDKTFIIYNDALNILRDELRQFQGSKKNVKTESQESDLRFLFDFVSHTKLSRTVDRNLLLVSSLTGKAESKDPKQRAPGPKEIIKLYDTIIQNVNEMSELRDSEDEEYHKSIAAKLLTFKAFRCFYVAHSYYNASKWPETLALLQRTIDYTKSALDHHDKCSPPSTEDIKSLKVLQGRVKGKRAASQAKAFAESQPQAETQADAAGDKEKEGQAVLNLDTFDLDPRRVKEGNLIDFPPDFEAIPCKPVLFDLALSAVEFPDLSERRKTKAKGFFGFWRS